MRTTAILLLALTACATSTPRSGTLYHGGTVFAGPEQTPRNDYAIYVEGGVIREVGPAGELRSKYGSARTVDATNATILPGLTDAHGHLYGLGVALDTVSLVGTTSYDEVIARTKARAGGSGWILGRGWDQNDWPVKEFPTAAALDAAIGNQPVFLERVDGHAGLANTAAMRAAGITAATQDPAGGKIVRDANGNPTGVFIDTAMALVERNIPPVTYEQTKARVLAAANRIAELGLTEMHDAGAGEDTIRAVKELIDEKRFPIRVYLMLNGSDAAQLERWFAQGPLVDYGGRLTVRSVKLYADGALGSRGAALLAPYADDPGNSGLMITKTEELERIARRALAAGFQVNTHAIGDAGNRNSIDAYERAGVTPDKRFRIEHLQVIALDDIPRLARNGIIASMQPTHATSDMYWAEQRVGPERVRGAYAWRKILDAGGRLALGSDFPVEEVNPFFGLYAAVTRQDQKGWPEGGWLPGERLTLAEAVRGFTADAAYAAFEEKSRGTIEVGKLADFTIVEGDLTKMPAAELWKAKVVRTVVGGE
ncbi:MAG TPA: amidohydrolase [Thermoanaerobaculia bacterium]